jgi:predicted DsbA family dithiol-disulfide isomerase
MGQIAFGVWVVWVVATAVSCGRQGEVGEPEVVPGAPGPGARAESRVAGSADVGPPVAVAASDVAPALADRGAEVELAEVVRVELTHDVVCPWCRIGHRRLERAIAALGRPVEVVYRPFLLEPDMPAEGADLRARLAAKYGEAQLDTMFARVTSIGAADGIVFDFARTTRSPSSVLAHVLVEAAPAQARTALLDRIHAAYFERGEDIGDAAVLERLWVEGGLPAAVAREALADPARRERVRSEALAASRSGIGGVPQMKIGGRTLSGAQPYDVLLEALRAAAR